jgi:hypothetical protein
MKGDEGREASVSNATARRLAMFETYDELIELGESPLVACERLGVKPANLMRTAYRWGRGDIGKALAAPVGRDKKRR